MAEWTFEDPGGAWPLEEPISSPLDQVEPDPDSGVQLSVPWALWRWLMPADGDVEGFKPPTLCVWFDQRVQRWHGVLHNRVKSLSLFRSAETLEELLPVLSDALHQEPAGWRRDRSAR